MVQDANVKRMHTEKLLTEAQSSVRIILVTFATCGYVSLNIVHGVFIWVIDW